MGGCESETREGERERRRGEARGWARGGGQRLRGVPPRLGSSHRSKLESWPSAGEPDDGATHEARQSCFRSWSVGREARASVLSGCESWWVIGGVLCWLLREWKVVLVRGSGITRSWRDCLAQVRVCERGWRRGPAATEEQGLGEKRGGEGYV